MNIVNRDGLMALPEGTIYAPGVRWSFDGLRVKGFTQGNSWIYTNLIDIECDDCRERVDRFEEMVNHGASYPINDASQRDGSFDKGAVYLVFEKDDLKRLIRHVNYAILMGDHQ